MAASYACGIIEDQLAAGVTPAAFFVREERGVIAMALLNISMALVSVVKGTGAFAALYIADQLFHIALEKGGVYVMLYIAALYCVIIAAVCLVDSAMEFMDIITECFDDVEDDDL